MSNKSTKVANHISVFQLKALKNTNTSKIKPVGIVDKGSSFADERIDVGSKEIMNNGEKALKITEDIYVMFYKSNISDVYLLTNKKLPVLYASIMYQRPFTTGFLFNLYLNFSIISDTSKIKNVNELFTYTFEGKYEIEIEIDEKNKQVIPLEKFQGYDETVKNLIEIIQTVEMKEIISVELNKRDEERRKRLGGMTDYSIPKPTVIFKDLVEKYEQGEDINF